MIPRYRPRRVMTTYSGRPRLLWRTFDDEGNWTGHHETEEAAWLVGDVDGMLEQRNCVCGSTISREKG